MVVVGEEDVVLEIEVVCIRMVIDCWIEREKRQGQQRMKKMMNCFKVSTSTSQHALRSLYI